MPIFLGANEIGKIYLGSSEVEKVYLGSNIVYSSASSLDFSALPNLPAGRQSAVTTAAVAAAGTLSVTAQSIINLVATSKGYWDSFSNTFEDSPPTALADVGSPIQVWRGWKGNDFTEADLSERPVKGTDLSVNFADVTDEMTCATVTTHSDPGATIFMTCQAAAATGAFCLFTNYRVTTPPVQGWLMRVNNGTAFLDGRPTSPTDSYRSASVAIPSPTAKNVLEGSILASTGVMSIRVNGGTPSSVTATAAASLKGGTEIRLNDFDSNTNGYTGKQFGITVFPSVLSATNATIIRTFMANLYEVTL